MWFKNLQLYRLPAPWAMDLASLDAALQKGAFSPCGSQELMSRGWTSPRHAAPVAAQQSPDAALSAGTLVHSVGGQWLLQLTVEQRLLPAAVVNQEVAERAAAQTEARGYPPGRKAIAEMKEQVTQELLPRAFTRRRKTAVWIDPENGWLGIDAASLAKAEEALEALREAVDDLPLALVETELSPSAAMADWLAGEAPSGFTIDRDCELQAVTEEKSAVRYVRHPLDDETIHAEIEAHLAAGKFPTKLALTFDDRISFLLTEKGEIKRLVFLDVLKEETDAIENADEIFDAEFALMTGEFARFLPALLAALGGERGSEAGSVDNPPF